MFYKKKIILDIETTGLDFEKGDRIIEICCLEIKNRIITNNIFHTYINPSILINKEAYNIHGINNEFLINKPYFFDIVKEFLNFINNSKIIIHNAIFDLNFLNCELNKIGLEKLNFYSLSIIDTLLIARKLFPNKRNSLDFLCKRFSINIYRKLHGALLDCKLLAQVYLLLTKNKNNLIFKKKKINKIKNSSFINKNIIIKTNKKDLKKNKFFFNKFN